MSQEGNSIEGQNDYQANAQPVGGTATHIPKARSKPNTKPRKKKSNWDPAAWSTITQIVVAFLGLIGTIAGAYFGYLATRPDTTPVSVLTATVLPSQTPQFTDVPVTATELSPTPTPSLSPTDTDTPIILSETATLLPQPRLIVVLEASKTSGKAPVAIKLDARASYMTDFTGQTYICRNGPCYYTWKIYQNGQQIGKSVTGTGGTFDYRFGKKGTYTVTVWVCRGRDGVDCGGSGVQIVVT